MKHSNHLLHVGCRTAPSRRVSAGCAPSGLALYLREHQGCRRCAQVLGAADPGVQDRLPHDRGQTRLDLLVDVGRYRRRCCRSGRTWARTGMGDGRRDARRTLDPTPVAYLTGVDLNDGSTADQGRTGREDSSSRLWRPARSLGTHAKQGPSTGHSAVGLRQAGNSLLTPRPHFTAPSRTLGNQVVAASDGAPFRQERRPTHVCRTPGAGSGLLAEASTPRAG